MVITDAIEVIQSHAPRSSSDVVRWVAARPRRSTIPPRAVPRTAAGSFSPRRGSRKGSAENRSSDTRSLNQSRTLAPGSTGLPGAAKA